MSQRLSRNSRTLPLVLVVALSALLLLNACGDPTATPIPTTTAVPKTAEGSIAAISGVTEIAVDPAILGDSLKMFPGASLKLYVSDEDATKLFAKAEAAIVGAGYQKFDDPTGSMSSSTVGGQGGLYSKGETADLVLAVAPVPGDSNDLLKSLNIPNITPEQAQKLAAQFKGKKTFIGAISTPGLFIGLIKGFASMTTAPGSTLGAKTGSAADLTVPPFPTETTVDPKDIPAAQGTVAALPGILTYPGATLLDTDKILASGASYLPPQAAGHKYQALAASANLDLVIAFYKANMKTAGYSEAGTATSRVNKFTAGSLSMYKDTNKLTVWVFGPADDAYIKKLASNDPTVTTKIKPGDSLVMLDTSVGN